MNEVLSKPVIIPAIAGDQSLYPVEKMEAHRQGLLHQAVSVFIFDGPDLLIQRRAASKYHCGGQWANTCCTHPHFGEAHEASALRRIDEELGIHLPLDRRNTVQYRADVGGGLWEHEEVVVFHGDADRETLQMALNPDEVDEVRWASVGTLQAEAQATPDQFTPWFRIYLKRWDELGV